MATALNVTIFGVGAMATLFGSFLSKSLHLPDSKINLTLLGSWVEQIQTIREKGLTFMDLEGRSFNIPLNITDNLNEVPATDLALILVKSYQTKRTAEQVAQVLQADGMAITLQNGVGNFEQVASVVGMDRTAAGVTFHAGYSAAPGQVQHAGEGATFLGKTDKLSEKLNPVTDLFNESGIAAEIVEDMDGLVWGKLAVNAGVNPLTALLEVKNGALLQNPDYRRALASVVREVVNVAQAQDISLPQENPVGQVFEVCRATAGNRSSMLQDILRGAPTENKAISGAVVEFGKQHGIPTPVNEFLFEQIKAKESGAVFEKNQLMDFLN